MLLSSSRRTLRLLNRSCPECEAHIQSRTENRPFTQKFRLQILLPRSLRPQLPYLHAIRLQRFPLQQQLARLISTETKKYIKDSVVGGVKLAAYIWLGFGLLSIAKLGFDHEQLERRFPTPPEWSWWSKWRLRAGKGAQHPISLAGAVVPNWPEAAGQYTLLVERLEDPNGDGAGTRPALGADGDIIVEGLGKTGADITGQSEPWRRGYYQALLGAATACEYVEGWVKDRTTNRAFPADYMIGPSNTRPKPMPVPGPAAPKEENCEVFVPSPHKYYMKIMTTTGFTQTQKLQAALAYADWLDFKNLHSSADEMYAWALDIASAAYTDGQKAPIDRVTGMLTEGAPISVNLLETVHALASHHAKTGNLTTALPMFLSVLRAQRSLPSEYDVSLASSLAQSPTPCESPIPTQPVPKGWLDFILKDRPYPPPLPSGDGLATRGPGAPCLEAATLSHIGELLYVTSAGTVTTPAPAPPDPTHDPIDVTSAQIAGLAWARDAVSLAESTLRAIVKVSGPTAQPGLKDLVVALSGGLPGQITEDTETKKQCADCLKLAMETWEAMVVKLARKENAALLDLRKRMRAAQSGSLPFDEEIVQSEGTSGWGLWSGKAQAPRQEVDLEMPSPGDGKGKWAKEANRVRERSREVLRFLREEKLL